MRGADAMLHLRPFFGEQADTQSANAVGRRYEN
jgi:hypothetical protein